MSDSNIEAEGNPTGDADSPGQGQPVQPAADEESVTDLLTEPLTQAYVKAIVALYALLGAGMGLMVIAADVIDQDFLDISGASNLNVSGSATLVDAGFAEIPIVGAPYIAAVLALLVGGYLAVRMTAEDRQVMITGAAGAVAGTFVLWTLSSFLAASQVDNASIDIGGLLVNGIFLGLFVGTIAAGTVYIVRNLVPDVESPAV
ncbi:hypothetical protein [Natronorubrum texcoconense]|uniref:Uncharacterized protein n=1 Tax=Natronorubrum texcoconense TaxID=1095776 RepID=A0A1G9GWJ4_9EURY|nr:hypothetical protein [Natronorubrum texcoconense]SDL05036.1 hypothetical protein SAMN04515672_0040 [Natronorubrum texcoconense]